MKPYIALATGFKLGYIEFVKESKDLIKFHKDYSYNWGMSVHRKWLVNWMNEKVEKEVEEDMKIKIKPNSPFVDDPNGESKYFKEQKEFLTNQKFAKYINQFLRSTAGSVVASYILDLGDRHSGNILIQEKEAILFHIDFGHILGHKKSKCGFKREVEPFIYLEEMHQLITYNYDGNKETGKKNFEEFQEYCWEGFKIARENFALFYNLLTLLVPAEISELDKESIQKTSNNFLLDLSDNEAKYEMRKMIEQAHNVHRRQFDNWFRLHCHWTKDVKISK
jgi:phosphatidylinositol kinase/protein kinase (PI-3  family)